MLSQCFKQFVPAWLVASYAIEMIWMLDLVVDPSPRIVEPGFERVGYILLVVQIPPPLGRKN
jgi:hypothetical protein